MKFIKQKKLMLSILLVVALIGVGATIALSVAKTDPVVNSFQAADHRTEIEEKVETLKKTVRVKNSAKDSAAYVRVRFEVSPSNALISQENLITSTDTEWEEGSDGFWYYTKPVPAGDSTGEIIWETTSDNVKEDITSFDVLVYEESCVATSSSLAVTVDDMIEAFKEADGIIERNQG